MGFPFCIRHTRRHNIQCGKWLYKALFVLWYINQRLVNVDLQGGVKMRDKILSRNLYLRECVCQYWNSNVAVAIGNAHTTVHPNLKWRIMFSPPLPEILRYQWMITKPYNQKTGVCIMNHESGANLTNTQGSIECRILAAASANCS